jgi:hypothetical protein
VDHIIELQVLGANWPQWANMLPNWELLDEDANASSGSWIMHRIEREREELAVFHNDRGWVDTYDLQFEQVVLTSDGPVSSRWSAGEIVAGEHIVVLRRMMGHQR